MPGRTAPPVRVRLRDSARPGTESVPTPNPGHISDTGLLGAFLYQYDPRAPTFSADSYDPAPDRT